MSRQVIGKRSHSSLSSYSPSPSTPAPIRAPLVLALPSPDPTPKSKRLKFCPARLDEDGSDSNKENIPPEPIGTIKLSRALFHSQLNGNVPLVGREEERTRILEFLEPFLAGEIHANAVTSLYVSGAPGTGKTAVINEILKSLHDKSLRSVYVNCMSLVVKNGMTCVWEHCLDQLGDVVPKKRGVTKMDWSERFGNLLRGQKCILVLDEIDHLAALTSPSVSIADVFTLTSAPQTRACLRIIGVSNTHTLMHFKPSPHNQTIHFQPYTAPQMKVIMDQRLLCLSASRFDVNKVFPPSTVALLTFKVANETGDIRSMFSIARRALELAAAGSEISSSTNVTPAHVLAALKASTVSQSRSRRDGVETVTRVRNLGLHSRFALAALLLAIKRTTAGLSLAIQGLSTSSGKFKENAYSNSSTSVPGRDIAAPVIEVTILHGFYTTILNRGLHVAFHGVGRTEFGDLIGLLEGSGLVEVQTRGNGSKRKSPMKGKGTQIVCIAKGVREEELVRGLVGSTSCVSTEESVVNVGEEEVKRIWEREMGMLRREIKPSGGVKPR